MNGDGKQDEIVEDSQDRLAPQSSKENAIIQPLGLITLSTTSLRNIVSFYVDGLGLKIKGPLPVPSELYLRYEIPVDASVELYCLSRPNVESAIPILVWVWKD